MTAGSSALRFTFFHEKTRCCSVILCEFTTACFNQLCTNLLNSLKAGNTVNMTSRCCSLPAATSVVSTVNTIQPSLCHSNNKYPRHCLNEFSPFFSPRWVHHWACDQGYEQQLASRLFLLWYLPGCARWCWICEECWKVSSSTTSHHHSTIIIQFKSTSRKDDHVYDAVLSGINVFLQTFMHHCHALIDYLYISCITQKTFCYCAVQGEGSLKSMLSVHVFLLFVFLCRFPLILSHQAPVSSMSQ